MESIEAFFRLNVRTAVHFQVSSAERKGNQPRHREDQDCRQVTTQGETCPSTELKVLSGFPLRLFGKTPWRRAGRPTPVFSPGGRMSWTEEPGRAQAMGLNESDTTEQVTLSLFIKGLSFPHPVRSPSSSPD